MLILTRGFQEKIIVSKDITITVLKMKRGKVRLGVHAPKNIPIRRGVNKPVKEEQAK